MSSISRDNARRRVIAMLPDGGSTLVLAQDDDELEIEVFSPEALQEGQVGYSVDPDGRSLTGAPPLWQPNWLVVGYETLLGDPIFVDLDDPELPVMTAMHDVHPWDPTPLLPSFATFLQLGE